MVELKNVSVYIISSFYSNLAKDRTGFCLQGFFFEKMHKGHSYLAPGAGEVLDQEAQPVFTLQPRLKSLYCASINSRNIYLVFIVLYGKVFILEST